MKLYILDSDTIVKDSTKVARTDIDLQGRELAYLVMAPLALIENRGIYYLTTRKLSPVQVIKDKYFYNSDTAGVSINLHPVWVDDGLKISPRPLVQWVSTPREIIADYSQVQPAGSWLAPELYTAWMKYFTLDKPY